jgi:hydrophobic/amphiphilic exporter-1 (mainly G- bacteria), HAE1 family
VIRFFAAHPTAANLMMIGILCLGIFAAPQLQRETFPRIEPRRVEISIAYPGARPEDVEQSVCQRIEDALDGVNNIAEVACEASENRARAVAEMNEGNNLDRFFSEVKTEIDAISDFPDQVEEPIVKQLGRTDFVASVAITGPKNRTDLKSYAEDIKGRMQHWPGISRVSVTGFSERQIRIELSHDVLRQFGLSVADIANTISRQSIDLPAGSISTSDRDVLVRFADERKRVYEFLGLVVVSSTSGGQIRLGDIAKITDRFDLDEEKTLFNGKPAALLVIEKTENEDTLEAIDAVNAFIENERETTPPGVVLEVTRDGSSIVRDRLDLLTGNGVQGLALVFLVLWLFFGFRFSFWVAMGLPVSFMGAIFLMMVMGYSINMLTMVGLLIAIGLLMDDAIIISENVATQRQMGKAPLDAAVAGARQVLPSIIASFTTTACIFGSLAFLKGDIGSILSVVPVVMLFVLSVSLIEAFLILPSHLHHSLGHGHFSGSKLQQRVDGVLAAIRDRIVGPVAAACVNWRYLTVGAAIGLFLISASLLAGGVVKFVVFPDLDGDALEAEILLPQGTPLDRTEAVVERVGAALKRLNEAHTPDQPGGQALVRNVTYQFNKNTSAFESGAHVATITADLLSAEIRTMTSDDILSAWRKETGALADVLSIKFSETAIGPGGLPIDIRLKGQDLGTLKAASLDLQNWLRHYRGVADLSDDLRVGKPEFRLRLNEGANQLGIDSRMVADQLRTAFFGTTVDEMQLGVESFEVDVRLSADDRNSLADLDYFTITTGNGNQVPLSAIAIIEEGRGYARINRVDGLRTVTIQGDVDVRIANANAIVTDTLKSFMPKLLKRYPGVVLALEGQNKEGQTTQKSMASGFALGLIGVFLLLSFQFRSYVEPLIVMIAIPLAFIGVVWGHLAMGLSISMPSMLGFVSLAGVVVNNSILLVNFIKDRHREDPDVAAAAAHASRARFRAIFLTTVTTVVGLLPILSETSLQAQVLIPLVTSLAFGLLASTLLVLIVVPSLFTILDDFGVSTISTKSAESS